MSSKEFFGWEAARKVYTTKDWINDSIYPAIISFILIFFTFLSPISSYEMIVYISEVGINMTPNIVALLLAAYAILMSMYWSSIGTEIKKNEENGKPLLEGLNASFVMAIVIIIIGFIFILSCGYVAKLDIPVFFQLNPEIINYPILFIMIYFISFFLWIIKDIAINIYDIGQYSIHN